jgi:hypothetical protein
LIFLFFYVFASVPNNRGADLDLFVDVPNPTCISIPISFRCKIGTALLLCSVPQSTPVMNAASRSLLKKMFYKDS